MGATELTVDQLEDAARAVRSVTASLNGEPRSRWWEVHGDEAAMAVPGQSFRHRSMYQGDFNPVSLPMTWSDRAGPEGEPGYVVNVSVDELHEGPPRSVHGGYLAGIFDELLGAVQSLDEQGGGYTGRLTVWYRALTPLNTELEFHGWIHHAGGRRKVAKATCTANGTLTAEAEGLFVQPRRGVAQGSG